MKTVTPKTKKTTTAKKTVRKKVADALSICPVNGAGWCPYPFSAAQLAKRLKRLQEEEKQDKKKLVSSRQK